MSNSRRTNLLEFAAVCFAVAWAVAVPYMLVYQIPEIGGGWDLKTFLKASQGNLSGYFYPPWLLPFFSLLTSLPFVAAWTIMNLISVAGAYYAVRILGGNRILVLISYPLFYVMYYGNVEGFIAAGLALMYLSLKQKREGLAALGWLILLTKIHVGLPLGLGLLWIHGQRKQVLRVTGIVGLVGLLSLIIWPLWASDLLERIQNAEGLDTSFSTDLWQILGPFSLLLWLPLLATRTKDFRWITTTALLSMPYMQPSGFLHLIAQPIGLIAWTGQLPYITGPTEPYPFWILPLLMYGVCFWQAVRAKAAGEQAPRSQMASGASVYPETAPSAIAADKSAPSESLSAPHENAAV